ncbi:MAG TPA: hypothetical protein VF194_19640 [Ferrovibrio sp.]|uniref:hypothetical protein n=1 Tax=Ferrovibrio sp. TaxID=1917215 RepID=UPI002ED679D0
MANKSFREMGPDFQYSAGGSTFIDIPRWGVLYEMMLRLSFRITTGGTLPAGAKFNTLARIIRGLSLKVNGKDTIVDLPGSSLCALAYNTYKRLPYGMSAALPSATGTAYDYVIYLPVTLYLPHAVRPDDTGLNLGSPRIPGVPAQLKINWAAADCSDFYVTPNGAVLSNVTCEVSGLYESDPEPLFRDGPSAGKPRFWMTRVLDQRIVDVTQSNSAYPVIIDEKTGVFYRSLHIETLADDAGVDTVLANGKMELKVGSDVYGSLNAGHLKDYMARFLGVDPQVGVYWWNFDLFRSAITAINTGGIPADLVLYMNVTKQGANTCQIAVTREGLRNLAV